MTQFCAIWEYAYFAPSFWSQNELIYNILQQKHTKQKTPSDFILDTVFGAPRSRNLAAALGASGDEEEAMEAISGLKRHVMFLWQIKIHGFST